MQRRPTNTQPEIRLICEGNTRDTSNKLANNFGKNKIIFKTYYTPPHNPKLLVFKFFTEGEKVKAENHREFNNWLTSTKCKVYIPVKTSTSESDRKTIFVWNLIPEFFLDWAERNDENLASKLRTRKKDFEHRGFIKSDYVVNIVNKPEMGVLQAQIPTFL